MAIRNVCGAPFQIRVPVCQHAERRHGPDPDGDSVRNPFSIRPRSSTDTIRSYYQSNPDATVPFPAVASLNDPTFNGPFTNASANNADGWGLRIINSNNILTYGAGFYSFFDNYSTACSANQAVACQSQIFSIEGSVSSINVYNLNTVGTYCMITRDGRCLATAADNLNTFIDTIALFRS